MRSARPLLAPEPVQVRPLREGPVVRSGSFKLHHVDPAWERLLRQRYRRGSHPPRQRARVLPVTRQEFIDMRPRVFAGAVWSDERDVMLVSPAANPVAWAHVCRYRERERRRQRALARSRRNRGAKS